MMKAGSLYSAVESHRNQWNHPHSTSVHPINTPHLTYLQLSYNCPFVRRISFHTVIFPGNGQGVPLQCGPPGAVGVVRTLDLTPPQMSITDVEVQFR